MANKINTCFKYYLFKLLVVSTEFNTIHTCHLKKDFMKNLLVFFVVLFLWEGSSWGQTVIFSEGFDGIWTTPSTLSPAWSGTTTATLQWQKNDYTAGWSMPASGSYSPTGANSTIGSARFHSYGISSGLSADFITPAINMSSYTSGTNYLEFYHINASGTDNLNVYLSTDGGTTWGSALITCGTASSWTLHTAIALSTTSSAVKLKFTGTSDYGNDDIGLDQVKVYNYHPTTPPNCATIVSPSNGATGVLINTTLNWADGGGGTTGYKVYYGTVNPPTGPGTTVTGTSYSPSPALTYSKTYYWKIVATNANGDAQGCSVWSFTTGADPTITSFPSCESFDGTIFPPNGWTNLKTAGTGTPGTWARQTNPGSYPTCTPHSGAGMAEYNSYSLAAGTTGILATPPINFPSASYKVTFWIYRDNAFLATADLVNVYYNASNPTATGGTLLGTINRAIQLAPVVAAAGWYQYSFNMPGSAAGNGRYIIFEAVSQYGDNIFMDDMCLEAQSTCTAPTEPVASLITSNGATINWTSNGVESSWDIEYGPAGFTPGSLTGYTQVTGTSTKPYPITALSASTTYDFYVRAACGVGNLSVWSPKGSFTTSCGAVSSFPWSEGFESLATVGSKILPPCWTYENVVGTAGPTSSATSSAYYGPNNGTHFIYTNFTNTTWIFSPQMQLGNVSYDFSFYMMNKYPTSPVDFLMDVAYGTTNSTAGMTHSLATGVVCSNSSYTKFTYRFTPGAAGTYYLGIKTTSTTGTPWYISFDDFQMEISLGCPSPVYLTSTNVNPFGATLGWSSSASAWEYQVVISGATPGSSGISTSNNPTIVLGLTPSTLYDFYVRSVCSGTTSAWSGPCTFTTSCGAVSSLPWSEGFESLTTVGSKILPPCWTYENVAGTIGPTSSSTTGTYYGPHNGTNYIYTSYNNTTWVFTPPMSLDSASYDFSFYMENKSPTSPVDFLMDVAYGATNNSAGMTNVLSTGVVCSNSSYIKFTYSFTPGAAGTYYFGVKTTSVTSAPWYISLDDFRLEPTPHCPVPLTLTITGITITSAQVGWTGATTVDIDYGGAGHTAGTGTIVSGVTLNPTTISTLSGNTSYDVYIRQNCGSLFSEWVGPYTFTTLCTSVSLPFSENFSTQTVGVMPSCWSTTGVGLTNWTTVATNTAGGIASPELMLNWSPPFTGASRIASPVINTTGKTALQLSFRHFVDWFSNTFDLSIVTTSNNGLTWNTVWTTIANADVGPETKTITINNTDVGSANFKFAFEFTGYSYDLNYWYLDDICIQAALVHDVGTTAIGGIPAIVIPATPVTPTAQVTNHGSYAETLFPVTMNINDGYTSTHYVTLAVGATATVTFDPWTPATLGTFIVSVCTALSGDLGPSNDCKYDQVIVKNPTKIYAYNAYDPTATIPNGPCWFYDTSPGVITSLATGTAAMFIEAGSWVNGVWYGSDYYDNDPTSSTYGLGGGWYTINVTTGVMNMITNLGRSFTGIAYDHTNNILYGVDYNYTDNNNEIYQIIPATGAATLIGTILPGEQLIDLGYTGDGLFAVGIRADHLYYINPVGPAAHDMGPCGFNFTYSQGMTYDYTSDILYAGAYTSTGQLMTVNRTSGKCYVAGTFQGGAELDGFAIPYSTNKILNLSYVFPEGLYAGDGVLNQAMEVDPDLGLIPKWPAGIADTITVELHNSADYYWVEYRAYGVALSTSGTATVAIPADYGSSYYLTIKHRNSIETTSASPVDFSGVIINYAFDTQSKAYGNNMSLMSDGTAVIFGGDVNQDGAIEASDLSDIGNQVDAFAYGYLQEDANGDGGMDGSDLSIAGNNSDSFIAVILP